MPEPTKNWFLEERLAVIEYLQGKMAAMVSGKDTLTTEFVVEFTTRIHLVATAPAEELEAKRVGIIRGYLTI